MIRLSSPLLSGNERTFVLDALDRGEITHLGGYVERFEQDFARYTGSMFGIATANGTTALHLALLAAGVKPNDRVLVPALTYVAVPNAVRYCGAVPIFCDIDPKTWCMSPSAALELMKQHDRVVAILPVHLYGVVADLMNLGRIANAAKCFLIEDAAEAHGACFEGQKVGGASDFGVFSFYGNKLLTTGEGGMVVTDNIGAAELMRLLRGQGVQGGNRFYHSVIGYNYRMTNLQAALGVAQLQTLDLRVAQHEHIRAVYAEVLSDFETQERTPGSVCWLYTVLLPKGVNREAVAKSMLTAGVETRPVFVPMTQLPMYAQPTPPNAQAIAARGLCLPTHAAMTDDDVYAVCTALRAAVN